MNTPAAAIHPSVASSITPLTRLDRVIGDLRRGDWVQVQSDNQVVLIASAENLARNTLRSLQDFSDESPKLLITGQRAKRLGFKGEAHQTVCILESQTPLSAQTITRLANPVDNTVLQDTDLEGLHIQPYTHDVPMATAVIAMLKQAGLLPAAVIAAADLTRTDPDMLEISVADIQSGLAQATTGLKVVAQAQVPLQDSEQTEIIALRPRDGRTEHLAIVVGKPDLSKPVLIRIHSECYTGDLLGSLRCDCGHQLRGAISLMAGSGGGIVLYLAQEGRGIGLINKLRAYALQDQGLDTVDANLDLGFEEDERDYQVAADMLNMLNIPQVRLLTNNPNKVEALKRFGIDVVERVAHVFAANRHNRGYLYTKGARSGHLFDLSLFEESQNEQE